MKNVLITGAAGFIGSALCHRLSPGNKLIGLDVTGPPDGVLNIAWEQADLTDLNSVTAICEKYSPDVVIHCAGIAHQKIGTVGFDTYMRVNSEATETLAKAATRCNPDLLFIFLSSVSVYGEHPKITNIYADDIHRLHRFTQKKTNSDDGIGEDGDCWPSSDYAASKLDAERRLIALSDEGIIDNLTILRLAPVYDRDWSFNLDRRVLALMKAAYISFGTGSQKMSALARPNLVDFITHILESENRPGLQIFNVCDSKPYEFNTIIKVFKKSGFRPNRPVLPVPLFVVRLLTRIAGTILPEKRTWIHSCYDKLASDLIFDNGKMLGTGFKPIHSLETIFLFEK